MNPEVDYQAHKLKIKHELQRAASQSKRGRRSEVAESSNSRKANIGVAMMSIAKSVISIVK